MTAVGRSGPGGARGTGDLQVAAAAVGRLADGIVRTSQGRVRITVEPDGQNTAAVIAGLQSGAIELGWVRVASGGMDAVNVDPRLVFGVALQTASAAIVVAHNHPGGNCDPSPQDRDVTDRLTLAGKLLGIRVLDHLILGRDGCYSFASGCRVRRLR